MAIAMPRGRVGKGNYTIIMSHMQNIYKKKNTAIKLQKDDNGGDEEMYDRELLSLSVALAFVLIIL